MRDHHPAHSFGLIQSFYTDRETSWHSIRHGDVHPHRKPKSYTITWQCIEKKTSTQIDVIYVVRDGLIEEVVAFYRPRGLAAPIRESLRKELDDLTARQLKARGIIL